MKDGYLDFDEYIIASEPHKRERAEARKVAIGLQAVDGFRVSKCRTSSGQVQDKRRKIFEGSPKDRRRIIEGEQNKSNCVKCDFLILLLVEKCDNIKNRQ
jgi:hypothetical protein